MSQPPSVPQHPLLACRDGLRELLIAATSAEPAYLPTADRAGLLRDLTVLGSQLEALRLRTLAASDDIAADYACRTAGDWLAATMAIDAKVAYAHHRLADALDQRYPALAAALAEAPSCSTRPG